MKIAIGINVRTSRRSVTLLSAHMWCGQVAFFVVQDNDTEEAFTYLTLMFVAYVVAAPVKLLMYLPHSCMKSGLEFWKVHVAPLC